MTCRFVALLAVLLCFGSLANAAERPNIVFIMSDDHGAGAVSSYGSQLIQTPGIDRLAREGMRFENCFVPNSLCTPNRAVVLTSLYPHQSGVRRIGNPLDTALLTFPKVLQAAGYQTAIVGKWHLGSQPQGFDYYSIFNDQGRYWDCPFLESGRPWVRGINAQTPVDDPRQAADPASTGLAPMVIRPGYVTDVVTDTSIAWLENRDKNKPFCLLVHHKTAHTPHQYPERYKELFTEDIPYPDTFDDDWATRDTLRSTPAGFSKFTAITGDLGGDELGKKPVMDRSDPVAFRKWSYQVFMKGYLRLLTALDENVARLLDYLDQEGLAENTLVVYTSDNGFFLGDHGLYNKMWMYDESIRIPLIARFPGKIAPGTVRLQMVGSLDLGPTFAALAGAEIPKEFQGTSLVPLFENVETPLWSRTTHYYHYYDQWGAPSHCGIRTATYKLLCFYDQADGPIWELFDLATDPNELTNIADRPQHEELLRTMKKQLIEEVKANGDPVLEKIR